MTACDEGDTESRSCNPISCGGRPLEIRLSGNDADATRPSGEVRTREPAERKPFHCGSSTNVSTDPHCASGVLHLGPFGIGPETNIEVRFDMADGTFSDWQDVPLNITEHTLEDLGGPGCDCTYYTGTASPITIPAGARNNAPSPDSSGNGGSGGEASSSGGNAAVGGTDGGTPSGTGGEESNGGEGNTGGMSPGIAGDSGLAGAAGGSSMTDAGAEPAFAPTTCDDPGYDPLDFEVVYEVGPGREFETPSDVPWENISPGTLVLIHYRAEPYRDKWVLNYAGTQDAPVVVLGVPEDGALPIISGDAATTRAEINFTGEERSVIKIGTSNIPDNERPSYITVACLDIQNAKPGYTFQNDVGDSSEFADNAATITIEVGDHITIENCELHDAGNGLFSAHDTSDIVVRGNYIHDNGIAGSIYEHNSYTESARITFEFNHYGSLCEGCEGNNLKDRSAGTVIRYNWIENGNRQLDLVETDSDEIANLPEYRETWVYGNVLVEGEDEGNGQILHYGGDGEGIYRAGTLYFFHNTLVSNRAGNTTLARLSTNDESMDVRNNVLWAANLAIVDATGSAVLTGNLIPSNWGDTHGSLAGVVTDGGNVEADDFGFADVAGRNYRLSPASTGLGQAADLLPAMANHPVSFSFTPTGGITPRTNLEDPGAFTASE